MAGVLDSRLGTPWHLLLLLTSGQVGGVTAIAGCLLAGGLATAVRGIREPRGDGPEQPAEPPPLSFRTLEPPSNEPIGSAQSEGR
jgi:hypothetical protein